MIEQQTNTQTEIPCPICHRTFKSMPALRMHHIRIHTKGWDTGRNFRGTSRGISGTKPKGKIETPEERTHRLAIKRRYQRALRARYASEGKDSRGQPYPEGYTPRKRKSIHSSPEAMKEYKRNWWQQKKAKDKIQIVYSPDQQQQPKSFEAPQERSRMNYCPECGAHIAAWQKGS